MPEKVDVLEIKSLMGIEMGGYLLIFSPDLHDYLLKIPGVTLDYNTIGDGICQVQVAPGEAEAIYQDYLKYKKGEGQCSTKQGNG